jgi:protocatechuate 3,4-dioxygenase beta subunit
MRKSILILAATLVASAIGISVMAAMHPFASGVPSGLIEITGRVRDTNGQPVAALKISLRNWIGADLASAVTDENGAFDLRNIVPGRYYFNFRPLAEDSSGETEIIDVPAHILRMNINGNRNPPAMAQAHNLLAAIA